jgi:polar amino acid transport system substrate-binding protein
MVNLKTLVIWPLVFTSILMNAGFVTGQMVDTQRQITISSGEWAPYLSNRLSGGGRLSQVVTESFALENIDVNYQYFQWVKSLMLAETGVVDATIGWIHSVEREQLFLYSEPLSINKDVFLYLAGRDIEWTKISDLNGMKIGIIDSFYYGDEFEQAETSGDIIVFRNKSEQQNFRLLLEGKIDLAIGEQSVTQRIMKRLLTPNEINSIKIHPNALREQELFLLFNKQNPNAEALRSSFNKGLATLKSNGRYQEIISQQ